MNADVDSDLFRHAMARYATGVAIVSACRRGVDHAMTCNSFASVSLEPPLVLVCIERGSRCHSAVLAVREWAVSVLPASAQGAARWFATRGRPLAGQFDSYPHERGQATEALWLKDSIAAVECRTYAVHPAGDHDVVVGRVVAMHMPPAGASADGADDPLVYYRRHFRRLGGTQVTAGG